ncbi:MAG: HAMP domain-containing histidine kinase [Ruminococcaceae bacterium]|nr:HAMP domain-containing histidine kinase [Oscillospiraceae bacterium]
MMLFLLLLLGLLWLFQVVFFGQIYKTIRISEIRRSADVICENIELDNTSLRALASETALERQFCALILDEQGNIIASEETISDCVIHELTARSIYLLYSFAVQNGGEWLDSFRLDAFHSVWYDASAHFGTDSPQEEMSADESFIYTRVVPSEVRGRDMIVILNTTISPVDSTVRTLESELILISIIMSVLALILSFVLARHVARPIVRINRGASQLAEGNYAIKFSAGGYREIAELSDTLNYAAEELSKTGALQRELIANISHDLRTPLTMIKGYAEVMRDIPGENTPENVQIIIDEAERLSSLVNDVLDISRLQSGTQELMPEQFNLTETVREVIGRFSKLTEQDGWVIEFRSDTEVMVTADRTRILQVIYNFINNAITHSDGDKTVTVTQRVTTENDVNRVRIEVTDRGEGIAPEEIPNIWDRYYKVDKLHRRAVTGSGLGLSIVKSILELHHARYGVESRIGEGSTFWFEL